MPFKKKKEKPKPEEKKTEEKKPGEKKQGDCLHLKARSLTFNLPIFLPHSHVQNATYFTNLYYRQSDDVSRIPD